MLICDTHADTLFSIATNEKDFYDVQKEHFTSDLLNTRIQVLALFVSTGGMKTSPTIIEREFQAEQYLVNNGWTQIRNVGEAKAGQANFMLSIEGGEAFEGNPELVTGFAAKGVRIAALTWNNDNGLCFSSKSGSKEGITALGWSILKRMNEEHMAIDLSHMNVRGTFDILEKGYVPAATHSCAYSICSHHRNLNNDQLKAIFQANGYVGVNFYSRFLNNEGVATLDTVIDHLAYMCDHGGENNIGFGSDFDGIDEYPAGLLNFGDTSKLIPRMLERGFGRELTEKIAGLNFAEYIKRI